LERSRYGGRPRPARKTDIAEPSPGAWVELDSDKIVDCCSFCLCRHPRSLAFCNQQCRHASHIPKGRSSSALAVLDALRSSAPGSMLSAAPHNAAPRGELRQKRHNASPYYCQRRRESALNIYAHLFAGDDPRLLPSLAAVLFLVQVVPMKRERSRDIPVEFAAKGVGSNCPFAPPQILKHLVPLAYLIPCFTLTRLDLGNRCPDFARGDFSCCILPVAAELCPICLTTRLRR